MMLRMLYGMVALISLAFGGIESVHAANASCGSAGIFSMTANTGFGVASGGTYQVGKDAYPGQPLGTVTSITTNPFTCLLGTLPLDFTLNLGYLAGYSFQWNAAGFWELWYGGIDTGYGLIAGISSNQPSVVPMCSHLIEGPGGGGSCTVTPRQSSVIGRTNVLPNATNNALTFTVSLQLVVGNPVAYFNWHGGPGGANALPSTPNFIQIGVLANGQTGSPGLLSVVTLAGVTNPGAQAGTCKVVGGNFQLPHKTVSDFNQTDELGYSATAWMTPASGSLSLDCSSIRNPINNVWITLTDANPVNGVSTVSGNTCTNPPCILGNQYARNALFDNNVGLELQTSYCTAEVAPGGGASSCGTRGVILGPAVEGNNLPGQMSLGLTEGWTPIQFHARYVAYKGPPQGGMVYSGAIITLSYY